MRTRSRYLVFLTVVGLTTICLVGPYLLHEPILNRLARLLVHRDPLRPADAITVIPGPGWERMRTGIRLFHKGYAHTMVLSGPWPRVLVRAALDAGVPSSQIIQRKATPQDYLCPHCSRPISGTAGDAQVIVRLLREKEMRSLIVVTSDYHSARTAAAFRQLLEDQSIDVILHPTQEAFPRLSNWWRDRNAAWMTVSQLQKTSFALLAEQLPDCLLHPLQTPLSKASRRLQSLLLPLPDFKAGVPVDEAPKLP